MWQRNIAYLRKTIDVTVHPQINTPSDVVIDDYDHITKVYKQVVDTGVDFNPSFILSPELTKGQHPVSVGRSN